MDSFLAIEKSIMVKQHFFAVRCQLSISIKKNDYCIIWILSMFCSQSEVDSTFLRTGLTNDIVLNCPIELCWIVLNCTIWKPSKRLVSRVEALTSPASQFNVKPVLSLNWLTLEGLAWHRLWHCHRHTTNFNSILLFIKASSVDLPVSFCACRAENAR